MPNKSKIKGNGFEREVVSIAKEKGFEAERAFASDGRYFGEDSEVDVKINEDRCQFKRRKSFPKWSLIDSDKIDLVIFREDRGEIFVLTRLDHYLKVKGGKNKK